MADFWLYPRKKTVLSLKTFLLESASETSARYSRNQTVFAQGDEAAAVYYIQQGQVRLTVVSFAGKEATLSVMGPQEFLGMECLAINASV